LEKKKKGDKGETGRRSPTRDKKGEVPAHREGIVWLHGLGKRKSGPGKKGINPTNRKKFVAGNQNPKREERNGKKESRRIKTDAPEE